MHVVTQNDIKNFNELYLKLHTYSAVSRETGFSPSTVKKYIVSDYVPSDERKIKRFTGDLPQFKPELFRLTDWNPLCKLSAEELNMLPEMWGELDI